VKSESEVGENQLRRRVGTCAPLYLLLAGNGTVPISTWRGLDMRSKECRQVSVLLFCVGTRAK